MSIRISSIHKQFGTFTALDSVTLDFPRGELVALLGPSGCGKTTLLRIIAGLETADSGEVFLDGREASNSSVRERQVGFVFQHYALFRHMTVFENVAFGLRMKPRAERPSDSDIRRRVHELLDLVQLDWLAERYPAQLSGGQRQRIALARALAVEPQVLLLDEPFGALDAKVRKELRRWLRRLHDDLHISSIFVTHDQEEALEVADRIVVMNHGKVEQQGTPEEVYSHPASPFVYHFLGSVNFFHGRVEGNALQVGDTDLGPNDSEELNAGDHFVACSRPHELELVPADSASAGLLVKVSRLFRFGALARLELDGQGEQAGQIYEAEVPLTSVDALALQEGSLVRIRAGALRVFPAAAPDEVLATNPVAPVSVAPGPGLASAVNA